MGYLTFLFIFLNHSW